MRVADFFCGGGGFSEGFRQAGFQLVFAVDKWLPAVMTYRGNHPEANVIQDDIIRISKLPDDQFESLVPDTEVIIGSPPCQAFSSSNKSGNGDKVLGIKLLEAYLRIVARKKFKTNSILRYWVLENVPNVEKYIKPSYSANDLGLEGDFVLQTKEGASGVYNAKYFGAPTNRKRYLCGKFPLLQETNDDQNVITLGMVLESLGSPLKKEKNVIEDVNHPGFTLRREDVSDHQYIHELAPFEWETAKRLKQDKGYMGKMSFPENLNRPARTVMATMSSSSRESMILGYGENRYRLPTVREAATMMSFPIDYRFYGKSRGVKHTLVGNAVPPKMSYAVAKAIALASNETIPNHYIPLNHMKNLEFLDLNGVDIAISKERPKRENAKFKYHIPYLIIDSFRVELTNYHSDFASGKFLWNAELHYSQGKEKARVFTPVFDLRLDDIHKREVVLEYIASVGVVSYTEFQKIFCMTTEQRNLFAAVGPYELLSRIRSFLDCLFTEEERVKTIKIGTNPECLPQAIAVGYYILSKIARKMGGI